MIKAPIWAVLVFAILVVGAIGAFRVGDDPHPYSMAPLLGCGVAMLTIIAALLVLLVHAWGWL